MRNIEKYEDYEGQAPEVAVAYTVRDRFPLQGRCEFNLIGRCLFQGVPIQDVHLNLFSAESSELVADGQPFMVVFQNVGNTVEIVSGTFEGLPEVPDIVDPDFNRFAAWAKSLGLVSQDVVDDVAQGIIDDEVDWSLLDYDDEEIPLDTGYFEEEAPIPSPDQPADEIPTEGSSSADAAADETVIVEEPSSEETPPAQ